MVFLGFGKYARADKIYAVEPIRDALDLAQRLAEQSKSGKVDLPDLGRRARRLLEASARPDQGEKLF